MILSYEWGDECELPLLSWFPGRLAWSAAPTPAHPPSSLIPSLFLPLFVKEACKQGRGRAQSPGLREWSLDDRHSIQTHSHTRAHTHAQSAQVKQVLAAFSAEFPYSLLFICRHAAEKEEFHFWSLWRVRMNIFIDCRTPKPLHSQSILTGVVVRNWDRQGICVCLPVSVSLSDDGADSESVCASGAGMSLHE